MNDLTPADPPVVLDVGAHDCDEAVYHSDPCPTPASRTASPRFSSTVHPSTHGRRILG